MKIWGTNMSLTPQQLGELGFQILENNPDGMRWIELFNSISEAAPENNENQVRGAIQNIIANHTADIVRVARGRYRLAKFISQEEPKLDQPAPPQMDALSATESSEVLEEADFYESFSDWLVENDEATVALSIGGNVLGAKWGTPDVIGVLKPLPRDIFKFTPQIVTAEIKVATNHPVVAFGQAVAYRLFSHKSYVVIPSKTADEDISRLKSLCGIHGIGLVVFELNKDNPNYMMLVVPESAEPDVFYVNSVFERLDADQLNRLF